MDNEQTSLLRRNGPQILLQREQPQPSIWRRRMVSVARILTFSIATILFLRWRRAVVPDVVDHEFGVGFDLTTPYGTAAISYPNGTIVNVAKIDGPISYRRMMYRLSLDSSKHIHPPYNSLEDAFRDVPRQELRAARKAAGLPASPDVGRLAQFILTLRDSVEKHLGGRKISGAVATIPHLPALYPEDMADAFEYAGLIYIPEYPYWHGGVLPESGAVYVANGFGTCSNYTDTVSCDHETRNPPHQPQNENILSVSYTRSMLISSWASEGMGFAHPGSDLNTVVDLNLGWDKRNDNPNEDYYWAAVRDAIITPVLEVNKWGRKETSKVFLHGEYTSNNQFQEVLREAVESLLENRPKIFAFDPLYSAARGAAEMAKRVYWCYNHTLAVNSSFGCNL